MSQQTTLCDPLGRTKGAALCLGDDEEVLRAGGISAFHEEKSGCLAEPTIHIVHKCFHKVPEPLHISLPAASCAPWGRGGSRVRAGHGVC